MKIGFYVDSLADTESVNNIFNQLNKAVEDQLVEDACLFYNKIDFNPITPKFGIFNATDLWSFTGTLIATTITNVTMAKNIINKFNLNYLYDQDRDFVGLLHLPQNVLILVKNSVDEQFIYRTTGRKPVIISKDLEITSLLQVIS